MKTNRPTFFNRKYSRRCILKTSIATKTQIPLQIRIILHLQRHHHAFMMRISARGLACVLTSNIARSRHTGGRPNLRCMSSVSVTVVKPRVGVGVVILRHLKEHPEPDVLLIKRGKPPSEGMGPAGQQVPALLLHIRTRYSRNTENINVSR